MEYCVVEFAFREVGNRNIMALLVIFGISVTLIRSKEVAILSFTTFIFYLFSYSFHCDFKSIDPNKIYRYIIWTGIDLLYVCTVLCFCLKIT